MTAPLFDAADIVAALGGRYALGRQLRLGGQGVVYFATRTAALDGSPAADPVALKLHFDPSQDERVEREIAAMEQVRHPSLANLIEHGRVTIGERFVRFVAWEFIDGEALDHRLRQGPLVAKTVASVGRDVARAIDHIWAKRIVHRDVNPKNIMLRKGDRDAVLIDLGVARHLSMQTITGAGLTWGTMGYLSPEQCRTETQLTCHSDVFCLAITLQECLTGRHPTGGDQARLAMTPPPTALVAPTAPAALAAIIDSMYASRAAFRPHPNVLADRFAVLAQTL
jgi:serine/threonine protein kinase